MKNIIVVDIDGTIANSEHRLHHIKKDRPDWAAFQDPKEMAKDKPIQEVIDLIDTLYWAEAPDYRLVFCTGRSELCREATKRWVDKHTAISHPKLIMRPAGDFRPDTEVKPEILKAAGYTPDRVAFILEDRTSVVKKWRELGYTCFQVANGDY